MTLSSHRLLSKSVVISVILVVLIVIVGSTITYLGSITTDSTSATTAYVSTTPTVDLSIIDNINSNNTIIDVMGQEDNGGIITAPHRMLRFSGGLDKFAQAQQKTTNNLVVPVKDLDKCETRTTSKKHVDVPGKAKRSRTLVCPTGQILLRASCAIGGNDKGINLGKIFGQVLDMDTGTTFVRDYVDGRTVATGVKCEMINTHRTLPANKRDATLTVEIVCGDKDDFPDVELVTVQTTKRKVPGGRTRTVASECPAGKKILANTSLCNVGGNGAFNLANSEQINGDSKLTCTWKSGKTTKRTATMQNNMLCGDPNNSPVVCDF